MSVTFGKWEPSIHDDFEQVKRMESAKKLKKDIVEIDREAKRIRIQGSAEEPYVSTLNECDCMDFVKRRLPCKHIYCLAFELGEMEGLPVYRGRTGDFDVQTEIDRYKGLYLDGVITSDAYVKICTALEKCQGKK